MTINEILIWGTKKLKMAGINSASREAEILLIYILTKQKHSHKPVYRSMRNWIYLNLDKKLPNFPLNSYKNLIKRRSKQEPLAYIIDSQEFFGLNFKLQKSVFIPRPETELLVEEALQEIKKAQMEMAKELGNPPSQTNQDHGVLNIIDIGTGSGCIIISLIKQLEKFPQSKKLKDCNFYAIDISKKALRVAYKNAKIYKKKEKIKFLPGNLLQPFVFGHLLGGYNIIIANLPYISQREFEKLPPSIKNYEPEMALLAGKDGLKYYKNLFYQLNNYKIKKTILFLEIGSSQKQKITEAALKYFPEAQLKFTKDYSKNWRIAKIKLE